MTIPNEIIEKAAEALCSRAEDRRLDQISTYGRGEYIEDARAALTAAAPLLMAQALRREADGLEQMAASYRNTSPYVRAGLDIIQRIRQTADALEQP